uniref:Uncharacterized protein n=1 Tax=viral metagenome TaxID=1070528 RepID=A0A6M3JIU6_9ZZZZ
MKAQTVNTKAVDFYNLMQKLIDDGYDPPEAERKARELTEDLEIAENMKDYWKHIGVAD